MIMNQQKRQEFDEKIKKKKVKNSNRNIANGIQNTRREYGLHSNALWQRYYHMSSNVPNVRSFVHIPSFVHARWH